MVGLSLIRESVKEASKQLDALTSNVLEIIEQIKIIEKKIIETSQKLAKLSEELKEIAKTEI